MPNDLDNRIKNFEKRLKKQEKAQIPFSFSAEGAGRAGMEILVSIAFFTIVGFLLDWQLGTLPWITLALFFLGFITGVYNAWRSLNVKGDRVGVTEMRQKPENKSETRS